MFYAFLRHCILFKWKRLFIYFLRDKIYLGLYVGLRSHVFYGGRKMGCFNLRLPSFM